MGGLEHGARALLAWLRKTPKVRVPAARDREETRQESAEKVGAEGNEKRTAAGRAGLWMVNAALKLHELLRANAKESKGD